MELASTVDLVSPLITTDSVKPSFWVDSLPDESALSKLDLPTGHVWHSPDGGVGWVVNGNVPDLNYQWQFWAKQFLQTGLWPIGDWCSRGENESLGEHTWEKLWRGDRSGHYFVPGGPYRVSSDVFEIRAEDFEEFERYDDDPQDWESDIREWFEDELKRPVELKLGNGNAITPGLLQSIGLPSRMDSLILVPCHRPADASFALDFGIPNDNKTPGRFTGVLRGWEQRFGLVPVRLQISRTDFQVLAPPSSDTDAQLLANELAIFASDSWSQGGIATSNNTSADMWGTDQHLNQIDAQVKRRNWHIWWD